MTENAVEAVALSKKFLMATERRTSLKERFVRGRPPAPKEFWALKNASFQVPKGSSLGLIGHNGSGKSTALKVLVGIYRPTSGHVTVKGSVSALLEVGAGFHPELTGRENIRLNATILGFTSREIDRFMDQIIEFADIGDHIDAPLKHYSSGMYVRLGFAVAVMVRPEVLIVDEVISVGDEEFQRKCFDYLFDLRRAGATMIIVSHGMGQIIDLCDEAVWLDHGQVHELGSARDVIRSYMDAVNAKEAGRATSPATPGDDGILSGVHPRLGTGEIRVVDLEVLDADGRPAPGLVSESSGALRLHYVAESDTRDVIFGIGIRTEDDVQVVGPNNRRSGSWSVTAGRGYCDFSMSTVLLSPGNYTVSTAVMSGGHFLDFADRQHHLIVRGGAGVDEPGLAVLPGEWSISMGMGVRSAG